MSSFSEVAEEKKEQRERKRASREKLAGFFYDIAKLVFAGLVVGGISPIFTDAAPTFANTVIVVGGVILTIFMALLANRVMNN